MLRVNECFTSLQGESSFAGRICRFIRLAGCPLNCVWCDTRYARSPEAGELRSRDELVAESAPFPLVEVTGGEPLAQAETPELLDALLAAGHTVLLETNGAAPLDRVPPGVHIIMDRKLPDSGMADRHISGNYDRIGRGDEIKFVIASRRDFDFMCREIAAFGLDRRAGELLASAVFDRVAPAELAAWILAEQPPVRMQLQLHKYIWDPERRGV